MASGFSLKDQLFNLEKTQYLAGLFARADARFDASAFEVAVMGRLLELELKERIAWIAAWLQEAVPGPLAEVAPVILRALPPPLDPELSDDDFGDFIFAPLGDWVVAIGLETPDLALDVIEEITKRFSMEWAVRPFLNEHRDLTLARFAVWAKHENYHVRRLVSEGTRPKLPWGQGVTLDPETPLPLLDQLHADPTRYVTRSVANHLNDITKIEPDLVLSGPRKWRDAGRQEPEELKWMTGHALRGLVKAGHPEAMAMLGYDPEAELSVSLTVSPTGRVGEMMPFSITLEAPRATPVLVDYIIHFRRPGGRISPKVHKIKQTEVNGVLTLDKRHKFKGDATTFKLVPGEHLLEVQVNGRVRASATFELLPA